MKKAEKSESVVLTVPEAGAALRLGKNAAYAAAARGEIPTIRIGKLLRVPRAAFEAMLTRDAEGETRRQKVA